MTEQTNKWTVSSFGWILLAILLIVCIVGFIANWDRPFPPSGTLLVRRDTLSIPPEQQLSRLQYLTAIVQQGGTSQAAMQIHRDDVRNQFRYFYIVILVALISFGFSKGNADLKRHRREIYLLAIGICLFMYGLDVHINDIAERELQVSNYGKNAVADILRIPPTDFRYYTLDYTPADSTQSATARFNVRIPREVCRAIQPNLEQMVFYMVPMMLLSFFWTRLKPGE